MKRLFLLCTTAALLAACATTDSAERQRRQAGITRRLADSIQARSLTVDIDMMHTQRGGSHYVSPEFYLRLQGDSVFSYLPYFGRAYTVPYGGGKGLDFQAPVMDYKAGEGRKGATRITFTARNEEDEYRFSLDVFGNGKAYLHVSPQNREQISYDGSIDLNDKEVKR